MPVSAPFLAVIAVASLVTLVLASQVIRSWQIVGRLGRELETFPGEELPKDDPAGEAELFVIFRGFLKRFRLADVNQALSQFDVDKNLTPIALYLRNVTAVARSSAGLMIIGALIVTLFNLQGAASGLGTTFGSLAKSARANAGATKSPSTAPEEDVVSQVQTAMQNVAQVAATAFFTSCIVISLSLILLSLSMLTQRSALGLLRSTASWAHSVHSERLLTASKVARNPQEQQADFSNAVAAFQGAIEAIKKLGDDLAGLDSVKTEMATAAQAIGAAVEGLPAAVGQSLTAVSSNVAREIAEELKQHYTITAQLVAIYGDSQITVKETAKLAQTLVAQGEDNVKSLKELASLPKANRLLAESIAKWQTTAEQLNAAGARLDELSRRWTELSGALDGKLESVNGKVQALGGATAALSGMLKEAAKQKDLTSLSGTITTSFNSLKRDVEALDESTRKADSAELAGIREVLAEMKRLSDQNIWKKLFGG